MNAWLKKILDSEMTMLMTTFAVENLVVLYLTEGGVLFDDLIEGTDEACCIPDPDEIAAIAKKLSCRDIVLMHNHPAIDGKINTNPSEADIKSTIVFKQMLRDRGINLIDHLIISQKGYFSLSDAGYL